jgi:hypothetical protein
MEPIDKAKHLGPQNPPGLLIGATTLSITTLNITILSIMNPSKAIRKYDTQYNDT